jgi:hypothetical protein
MIGDGECGREKREDHKNELVISPSFDREKRGILSIINEIIRGRRAATKLDAFVDEIISGI